ncbi:MAG: 4-alpha-glucanotransferase [Candidatus Hodarchaeales archaeon]|jgi:4-alpha-glucanotransferase
MSRKGGVILHPTSLPSMFGIGELGTELYRFIDLLSINKIKLWQILPLGPTGYGNSPYSCFSAFAGNPFLISIEKLLDKNYITGEIVKPLLLLPKKAIDFGKLIPLKWKVLKEAYNKFKESKIQEIILEFDEFCKKQSFWLEDFSKFMSAKEEFNDEPWINWPQEYRLGIITSSEEWIAQKQDSILFHKFVQFLFFEQWFAVKKYANSKGIEIIGDVPIFVAFDSADVWSNRQFFYLSESGDPEFVAGVPPDYFSPTGQRWGNPLFRWDVLKEDNYDWWIQRIKHATDLVDIIRIDHFRGFESYWRIPANESTAINGKWTKGPGMEFFNVVKDRLGELPIIAEDLGMITPEVEKLLSETGFPGMKVLQFAFGNPEKTYLDNPYLPHNFDENCVVYTGTHDNPTTLSWYLEVEEEQQNRVKSYCKTSNKDIVHELIKLTWSSKANFAIIPLQDLLRLDDSARMNTPGSDQNNWIWRLIWDKKDEKYWTEIKKLCLEFNR